MKKFIVGRYAFDSRDDAIAHVISLLKAQSVDNLFEKVGENYKSVYFISGNTDIPNIEEKEINGSREDANKVMDGYKAESNESNKIQELEAKIAEMREQMNAIDRKPVEKEDLPFSSL